MALSTFPTARVWTSKCLATWTAACRTCCLGQAKRESGGRIVIALKKQRFYQQKPRVSSLKQKNMCGFGVGKDVDESYRYITYDFIFRISYIYTAYKHIYIVNFFLTRGLLLFSAHQRFFQRYEKKADNQIDGNIRVVCIPSKINT